MVYVYLEQIQNIPFFLTTVLEHLQFLYSLIVPSYSNLRKETSYLARSAINAADVAIASFISPGADLRLGVKPNGCISLKDYASTRG